MEDIKELIEKKTQQIKNLKEKIIIESNPISKEILINNLNDLVNEKIKLSDILINIYSNNISDNSTINNIQKKNNYNIKHIEEIPHKRKKSYSDEDNNSKDKNSNDIRRKKKDG